MRHNITLLRRKAGKNVRIILPVKANAYGHGITGIARHAIKLKVDMLAVARSNEALLLRDAGIKKPILQFACASPEAMKDLIHNNITLTLCSPRDFLTAERFAAALGKRPSVHLKIDTGMGRLGWSDGKLDDLLQVMDRCRNLKYTGLYTHFACADMPGKGNTLDQIRRFDAARAHLSSGGRNFNWVHCANSAGVLRYKNSIYNAIRPGLASYGYNPLMHQKPGVALKPVMSLHARVLMVKDVPAGTPLGYGATWRTYTDCRVATISAGYGDGIPWNIANQGNVLIRGRLFPLRGRVSMDLITVVVDRTVKPGDEVVLFGRSKNRSIRVEDVALQSGTIPYDICTRISQRVPRIYTGE